MPKNLSDEEEYYLKDCTDSDRYSIDNLDLLNLRVSFSSDGTPKHRQTRRSNKNFIKPYGEGDQLGSHTPKRCQHHRYKYSGSGNSSENEVENYTLTRQSRRRFRSTSASDKEASDDKAVHLLYSNQGNFRRKELPRNKSDESLPPLTKDQKSTKKRRTINIYSINDMAQKTSSKNPRPRVQESLSGDGGTFPFKVTPSGNFKVNSQQVVFESQKLSVLVADPKHTKVNIHPENSSETPSSPKMSRGMEFPKDSAMGAMMNQGEFGSISNMLATKLGDAPIKKEKESSEYEGKQTNEILDPELNLNRLGYTAADAVDWDEVKLPEKTNLYLELYTRITNYTNADCKVYIDNEEFNCHLIVLQCYSGVFDEHINAKKVELPGDNVSPSAFAFIYEWMITGEPSYRDLNRENVLDIFNAAKYLKIKGK